MEKRDLVTIIVCSYNQGSYIRECLDSIKAQTYNNIQLIVADDASPDNSVQVFEDWLNENNYPAIKNFHQKNTGLATILNECLELIEGEYVKVIAADDFLHPEAIEKCIGKLKSMGENYGMVYTDTYGIDDHSNILKDIADYNGMYNEDPEIFRQDLIKNNRIAALTVVMRKEALTKTGAYRNDLLVEDYYRWLMISSLYHIAYIPEKLAYYRLHSSNISSAKTERIDEECLYLQIMFDTTGQFRKNINYKIEQLYLGNKLSKFLQSQFQQYSYKKKRLAWAIQYNISPGLYTLINRYL